MNEPKFEEVEPTGIGGLDRILNGGYPQGRIMLVAGAPGTGKTTLALQFLADGVRRGKKCLFYSIAQSRPELEMIAASHGFDLDGVEVVTPELGESESQRIFSVDSNQAALVEMMDEVRHSLETSRPEYFIFDSLLELRLLAGAATHYRRELLTFRRKLREVECTTLLVDHLEPRGGERNAEGIVHGVIRLEAVTPPIGVVRQRLTVVKLRGQRFIDGYHDFKIVTGGLVVYPRVIPADSGLSEFDKRLEPHHDALKRLLGGGLEFGSSLLIAGQSGTGKSTLATVLATDAARCDEKAAMFIFEERPEVLRGRSEGVGLEVGKHENDGKLSIRHFNPSELSPGEFSNTVIDAVKQGVRVIVIDSLTGYLEALPKESNGILHLHTLIQYLTRQQVLVIVTISQHGLLGEAPRTDIDSSFIADTVILLRHYESGSEIRRSVAVVKKRQGDHERSIEELVIRSGAVEICELSEAARERAKSAPTLGGV